MPIYSYQCEACDEYYEEWYMHSDFPDAILCKCGEYANKIIAYAPSLGKGTKDGNFKPYYDMQLDQHFQSADEKKQWLKANDYEQVSGDSSPQESKEGNFYCTETQASKLKRPD